MAGNDVITFGAAFDPNGVVSGVNQANRKFDELLQHGKRSEAAFVGASRSTTQFSEKGRQTLAALSTETKKTSSAFQRLAADVRLAQADFRAGKISSTDLGTALQMAQGNAMAMRTRGIIPAGADLAAFSSIMGATARTTQPVVRGLGTVRSTLGSLSAMAIGTKGTLGTLGSALGFMTFGNLATIGIFGGLAAAAAGFRLLGKEAREAKEKITAFIEEQKRAAIGRLPEAARIGLTVGEAGERVAQARALVERREAAFRLQFEPGREPAEPEMQRLMADDLRIFEARKQLAVLLGQQAMLEREETRAADDERFEASKKYRSELDLQARALALQVALVKDVKEIFESLQPANVSEFIQRALPVPLVRRRPFGAVAFQPPERTGFGAQAFQQRRAGFGASFDLTSTPDELASAWVAAETRIRKASDKAIKATEQIGVAAISVFSSLAQSLIRGDATAGAVVGGLGAGIGGIVGMTNPLLGAGIAAAGGIIGALFGGGVKKELPVRDESARQETERLRRTIEALEARRPKHFTIQLLDSRGNPVATRAAMANINRESALGAIPLLP